MISLFFKATDITGIRDHPGAYGDVVLAPIEATHAMTLNGECILEVTIDKRVDASWEFIDTGDVFFAPVPWSAYRQLFRCYEFDKGSNRRAVFYCRHILFDLAGYTIVDTRPTMQNGQGALTTALAGTPFSAHSNITATSTAYWVRKKVTEALWSDDDNSFASRWGGEYLCDNYDLYINEKVGTDRGVRIEYRRNLQEIKVNKSEDDVVTRIIPVGYDGIMLDGDTPWVDSPLISTYPARHDGVIAFDDIKYDPDDDEAYHTLATAQAAMVARCKQIFADGIDKPSISYDVSMVDLSKLDAYKDYKVLETVSIGDTVHVSDDELDINVDTRVIAYEYDWSYVNKKHSLK
ncbi:phage minor structural protein, N-terminal region [Eubacterium aggregans]|uniref:Phage minor structural protein, N-terminal region n=1 Tax=Eubacterium aggregans TaxID=81409 RepID=A0A1H4BMM4_9FIRM|nr:phage tail spike protein [Eubacterium aggregans]SEA49366.1 phage minor structural protein, N-terminal region [Eubacterium aggregans]